MATFRSTGQRWALLHGESQNSCRACMLVLTPQQGSPSFINMPCLPAVDLCSDPLAAYAPGGGRGRGRGGAGGAPGERAAETWARFSAVLVSLIWKCSLPGLPWDSAGWLMEGRGGGGPMYAAQ